MNAMKEGSTTVSRKSDLMMSVSQSESKQYINEDALISWQKSVKVVLLDLTRFWYKMFNMQGGLLQVSIINSHCSQWSRFFFALRNLNKFTETVQTNFFLS